MITTYDEWKADDSAYGDDRVEVCDRCHDHVRPSEGTAIVMPGSTDEGWVCFLCADEITDCAYCGLPNAQCKCEPTVSDYPEDMDGDAGSALESVYGPND